MIDIKDFKKIPRKNNPLKVDTLYRCRCDKCGSDRGYQAKVKGNNMCRACSGESMSLHKLDKPGPNLGKRFSKEARQKMSAAKLGNNPWNKGLRGVSDETREKMSSKKRGKSPPNIGIEMGHDQRVKLSCINQGIPVEEFSEFKTPKNRLERAKFYEMELHLKCFEKADYTCDKCNTRGTRLHAHHMNSWAFFEEERYSLENLVCLCDGCHRDFHSIYGNGKANPNTKDQYLLFKDPNFNKKELIILTGAPASGKSWVAKQLKSKYDVIDSDLISKKLLVKECTHKIKPLLTLTVGVSTFIKNNPQFSYKLIVIQEDEVTIEDRMIGRGGKITNTIQKRIKRMHSLAKQAVYSGTSNDVLLFLRDFK